MKGLMVIFGGIVRLLARTRLYIPPIWAGLFIAWKLVTTAIEHGIVYALKDTANRVFLAEKTINELVTKAIQTPELYGFMDLVEIATSAIIMFVLIKFFANLITGMLGANEKNLGRWLIGAGIVFLIEFAVSSVSTGKAFDFIPIKDGIFYLIMNFSPVFNNVDWLWLKTLGF